MLVRILEDDPRCNLHKDEIYEAKRYWLDPGKYTLMQRVPDGFNPECNVYSNQITVIKKKK